MVGERPDLIVSGINHGSNLGDDITYSGTVAAALEGIVLGIPSIAVSQQSAPGEMGYIIGRSFDFRAAAWITAGLVERVMETGLPEGTLLNVNVPADPPSAVVATKLRKRIYDDELKLVDEDGDERRRYRIYGFQPSFEEEPGTDLQAISDGMASVTPLHFDLTDHGGIDTLREWDLEGLLPS